MTESQRIAIEQHLLREYRRSIRALGRYGEAARAYLSGEASGVSRSPSHMADQASETMEREMALFFASQEGRQLTEIETALRRLYERPESFGLCRRCGTEIPFLRLEAVPQTTTCLDCQRTVELAA